MANLQPLDLETFDFELTLIFNHVVENEGHRVRGTAGCRFLVLEEHELSKLHLPLQRPAAHMPLIIYHNGSIPHLRTLVEGFLPNDDAANSTFNVIMTRACFGDFCLEKHVYLEDDNAAIVAPIIKMVRDRSSEMAGREGIWVRGNDGTPMVKDILAPVLGFFICYDPVFNYHLTLFDSLVVTYWGEIKFFSTKLVNELKVDDKDSKQNIRDLIEWINSMTNEGELAPLPVRNLVQHLDAYDSSFSVLRYIYFDVPFVHPWHDVFLFMQLIYMYFCRFNATEKYIFLTYFPRHFDWIKEISNVVDILNQWAFFRQIQFANTGKEYFEELQFQNVIEFYINFLKHVYGDLGYLNVCALPTTYEPYPPGYNHSYSPHSRNVPGHYIAPAPVATDYIELVELINSRLDLAGCMHKTLCWYLKAYPGEDGANVASIFRLVLVWHCLFT